MHPVLFRFKTPAWLSGIFPDTITLYSYGFFILLGILAAYYFVWRQRKAFGLDHDKISDLFLWAFVGIFVGGKLFFYFEDISRYLGNPSLMFHKIGSGFVFYGSFLVGIPVLIWRFKKLKLPIMPMLDVIAIAGALVHGFGKVGCLMSGCCHGKVCESAWSLTFHHPESSAEPLDTPLYPTQIYDALLIFSIVAFMIWYSGRKRFHGQLLLFYAILYGVGRTLTEIYRGDEERGYIIDGMLSHSQFLALLILIGSAFLWKRWKKKHPVRR
ncbi:MAG: prolipoprotein diacylglyceryl transferase [Bacteroidia bacterium]